MLSSEIPSDFPGLLGINATRLEQFLTPEITKFVIGNTETEFNLHSSLVSTLSVRFRSLVEDNKRSVYLRDVDEDVFSRFAQFIYSGSYTGFDTSEQDVLGTSYKAVMTNGLETQPGSTALSSTLALPAANADAHESQLNSGSDRLFGSSLFGNKTTSSGISFGRSSGSTPPKPQRFQAKLPYSLASCEIARKECSQNLFEARVPAKRKQSSLFDTPSCELHESCPHENKLQVISNFILTHLPTLQLGRNTQHAGSGPVSEHSKHVLIGHARVWCFAREYALVSLAGLARENLIRQLVHWVMSEDTFIPIFGELVRLVYHDCTGGHVENSLHHVLAQFASCVFEDVRFLEGWHELIAEVPSFPIDLVYKLTDRCA